MSRKSRSKKRRRQNANRPDASKGSNTVVEELAQEAAIGNEPSAGDVKTVSDIESELDQLSEECHSVLESDIDAAVDASVADESPEPVADTDRAESSEIADSSRNESIVNSVHVVGGLLDRFIVEYNSLNALIADGLEPGCGSGSAKLGIQEQLSGLEERLLDAQEQNEQLRERLRAASENSSHVEELTRQVEELNDRLTSANRRNDTLTESLTEALAEVEHDRSLEQLAEKLRAELNAERQRTQLLTDELTSAASALQSATTLQHQLDEAELLLVDYQQEIDSLQLQLTSSPMATATEQELQNRIAELESRLQTAADQSESSSEASVGWEEQKQRILEQMESDTFSAEEFLTELSSDQCVDFPSSTDPATFVRELCSRFEALSQSSGHVPPAADGDVSAEPGAGQSEEAARWEAKFNELQTQASLERAKFSRERREWEARINELQSPGPQDEEQGNPSGASWKKRFGFSK